MAKQEVWDFWAKHYEGLWAQHFVLGPSRALVRARIAAVAPTADSLLDAGCGVGQLLDELAQTYPQMCLFGFDPSASMIEVAKQRHDDPQIDYRVGTLDDEKRGPFDIVTLCNAFPYVADHALAAHRLYALLKPGGHLFIVQANTENHYDALALRLVKLTTSYARYHSTLALQQMMQEAGFVAGAVQPIDSVAWIPSVLMCEFVKPMPAHFVDDKPRFDMNSRDTNLL
jgi:2-polyprenyl-3-methyl-5-hydroxy-6-metoxy-1,4-benzoquinol methylase